MTVRECDCNKWIKQCHHLGDDFVKLYYSGAVEIKQETAEGLLMEYTWPEGDPVEYFRMKTAELIGEAFNT